MMSTIVQVKAIMALQVVALAVTVFRVWVRLHIRRFWYDDGFAAAAGLCCVVKVISSWTLVDSKSKRSLVPSFWITTILFPCVLWLARMSILLSITRIARPTQLLFRLSLGFEILFFLMLAGSITQRAVHCEPSLHPKNSPNGPFCNTNSSIVFYDLATSCVSDVALVVFSFRLLWKINLPTRQRRMILIIFSSSVMMSLLSTFNATSRFAITAQVTTLAVNLEVSCSLIICNLLVIVTYAYRVLNRKPDVNQEDDDFSSPIQTTSASQQHASSQQPASSQQLTTVELNTFVTSDTRG